MVFQGAKYEIKSQAVVATGQENVREKLLKGKENSGKIDTLKKRQR